MDDEHESGVLVGLRIAVAIVACGLIVAGAALIAWPLGLVAGGVLMYIEIREVGS